MTQPARPRRANASSPSANGTDQGATFTAVDDVVLVRADAAAYCIETGVGAAVEHEAGPGGSPQPGAC